MRIAVCLLFSCFCLTAAEKTLTGRISDDMCGADHSGMPQAKKISARECALDCAKAGSKWVFVSGPTVYAIENQNLPDLPAHAGHKVKVTGDLSSDGKTLTIGKVEMLH